MNRLRNRVFSHITRQEIGFFDRVRTGELVNRLSEVGRSGVEGSGLRSCVLGPALALSCSSCRGAVGCQHLECYCPTCSIPVCVPL